MLQGLSSTGLQVLAGHSGPVTCGVYSSDGSSLITGGGADDCSLRIWNTATGACSAAVSGHLFHAAGKPTNCCLHTAPVQMLLHVPWGPAYADCGRSSCQTDLLALTLHARMALLRCHDAWEGSCPILFHALERFASYEQFQNMPDQGSWAAAILWHPEAMHHMQKGRGPSWHAVFGTGSGHQGAAFGGTLFIKSI